MLRIWEGNMFWPGIRTSCRATSLRITSCSPTNPSHGCFGQKPSVERWTYMCTNRISYVLRFRGLWKQTTTWSTTSGSLELLLKLWNSKGDRNQVVEDASQTPLRNTITCSTKTERVIRTKSGGRIDKWVIITLRQKMERKHFVFRWFHSTSGPTSSFQRTAGALSTSWASLWGINWYRSKYGSVTIGLWKLLAGIPPGGLTG